MAIYHLHAQIISRSAGRSAVAAAAYRSCESITNEYDGVVHDFTEKQNLVHSEILLPENAPAAFGERSVLWNAVEMSEKNSNAQLAREIEVALPAELSQEQQINLVRKYCQDNFVSQGMVADFAIHNPPVMDGHKRPLDSEGNPTKDPEKMVYQNPHCHIMLTLRPMDANGNWEAKSKQQYVCVRDGDNGRETQTFSAEAFKKAQDEGWQKQFQYKQGKKKVWLTQAEGEVKGLERVNKFPKTEKLQNETLERWNSKDRIFEWRENWAQVTNAALEKAGKEDRIDHRSYAEQGIEQIPTVHMGPSAVNMEKKGKETDVGKLNRSIREENSRMQKLREQLKDMVESAKKAAKETKEKAKSIYTNTANTLESIRARFIGNSYRANAYERDRKHIEFELRNGARAINVSRAEERRLYSLEQEKKYTAQAKKLQKEIKGLSGLDKLLRGNKLNLELNKVQINIERLHETDNEIYRGCGLNSAEEVKKEYIKCVKESQQLDSVEKSIKELKKTRKSDIKEFRKAAANIPEDKLELLDMERLAVRPQYENQVQDELSKMFGKKYLSYEFDQSVSDADRTLTYSEGSGRTSAMEKLKEKQAHIDTKELQLDDDIEHERPHKSHDRGR